jgi:predicted component of type VI protein secretion system
MADFTFVEKRPMEGHEHTLDADVTIGREGCEVVLPDPEVSRRHATLRKADGGAAVEDLGSTNGTFVNGKRITGLVALVEGDLVRFGNTEWELRSVVVAGVAGVGSPQVTAARSVPAEPPTSARTAPPAPPAAAPAPPAAAPAPPAAAPAPPAAAAPAAPAAAPGPPQQVLGDVVGAGTPGEGRRGDVPQPSEITPSAIHRTLPQGAGNTPVQFAPSNPRRVKGSAATRGGYTLFCLIVTALVIAALIVYFATR